MTQQKSNLFLSSLFGLFLLAGSVIPTFAQYCPGSELAYIVRDEKGKIINPATLDAPDFIEESVKTVSYAEIEKKRDGYWRLGEAVKTARAKKQGDLDKETGNFNALHITAGGACSLSKTVTFKLTLGSRTMNLIFRFVPPKNDAGEVFIVDSLPFQQGTFEIELPEKSDYYAPDQWRKTSDAAEKPAPIVARHIRGRVINAVTKMPVENAVVFLNTMPGYYTKNYNADKSTAKTNAGGQFALENLRSDYFGIMTDAAVFVEHADFALGTYAYLFHRNKEKMASNAPATEKLAKFESRDDLVIELVPLVMVSGRIIDAETGKPFPASEAVAKEFSVSAVYGKGGYLGGNISLPRGRISIHPQPDGSFTFRTAPGKNEISGGGILGEKGYQLAGIRTKIDVPADGLTDLVLKYERDRLEIKRESAALVAKGNESYKAKNYEDALGFYEQAAQIKPDEALTHTAIVQTYAILKRANDAVLKYRQAVTADKDDATAHFALGYALGKAEKRAEAVKEFEEAIRLKPDFVEAFYGLGNIYRQLKNTAAAREAFKKVITLRPDTAKAYENIAYTYIDEEKYLEGFIWMKEAVRVDPKVSSLAYQHIGYQSRQLGLWKESAAAYKIAISLAPDDVETHYGLGWALHNLKYYEQAIAAYREGLKLKTDYAGLKRDLGAAYYAFYKYQEALKEYEEAARLAPNDPETHLGLGLTYLKLDNVEAARAQHKILLALDPKQAGILQKTLEEN